MCLLVLWWCPQRLGLNVSSSQVTGEFPSQWPVARSFDFFLWSVREQTVEQTRSRWFETPLCSLWRRRKATKGFQVHSAYCVAAGELRSVLAEKTNKQTNKQKTWGPSISIPFLGTWAAAISRNSTLFEPDTSCWRSLSSFYGISNKSATLQLRCRESAARLI